MDKGFDSFSPLAKTKRFKEERSASTVLRTAVAGLWILPRLNRCLNIGVDNGIRCIFAFGENYSVVTVEPATNNSPPDCRIELFESLLL